MYNNFFATSLAELKKSGNYRYFKAIDRPVNNLPGGLLNKKDNITVWCSNDYLGMSQNPKVINAAIKAIEIYGIGSGGTRNISGTTSLHVECEQEVAELHNKESGLLFSSCYTANDTTIATLGKILPNCVFFSDQENHASLIQGIQHSRCEKHIFKHNDVDHLEELLKTINIDRPKVIVFESIYSMTGDKAKVKEIAALAKKYNAITFLDEVHAVGVYGTTGGGISEDIDCNIDIISGTFGKAYGVFGGYIVGNNNIIDCIRSYGSGFIFTTSLPIPAIAAAKESVKILKKDRSLAKRAKENAKLLKSKLTEKNIKYLTGDSNIIPIIIGNSQLCNKITAELLEKYKIYLQPINYPTVPMGTERVRVIPTPYHSEQLIQQFVNAFSEIINKNF